MARNRIEDSPAPFLAVARRAAERCGVTRLADITGLDRVGLPVWQAIRPASRALSVHQGKGRTATDAQIGALCEAVESHCAEQVEADGPTCPIASLPALERVRHPGDLLLDRAASFSWDEPMAWCTAHDLATGRRLHLPHAFVSLDFRSGRPSPIERSSNGIGAGPTKRHALTTALMELVERDALGAWNRASPVTRLISRIDPGTIPFGWYREWRERLSGLGAELDAFELDTVTAAPAFRCTIRGEAAFGPAGRLAIGSAAHTDPETALAKAFAEAAQTRLTLIAAARDDLLFRHYRHRPTREDEPDWPPGRPWRDWADVADPIGWTVDRLAARGYDQVAIVRLGRDLDGMVVLKAFVPGLGMLSRTRRVPG